MSTASSAPNTAFRNPDVLRWLVGFGLSILGDHVYFIALGWSAAQITTPVNVGLILAAGSIPRALLLPIGGAAADRVGPKRLVVISDATRAVVMVLIAVVLFGSRPSIAVLVVLAIIFGAVDALFLPAVGALPPRLVDPAELARLQGMRGMVQRGGLILGAPLAGVVTTQFGLTAAFLFTAGLFTLSVVALVFTRLRPAQPPDSTLDSPGGSLLGDVRAGFNYTRSHKLLTPLLVISGISEFTLTGPLNTGLPLLAADRGWGAQGIGYMLAGFGIGAGLGSLLIAIVGRPPRAGVISCLGLVFAGAALAGVGLSPFIWWATLCTALAGLTGGIAGALLIALVTAVTRQQQLGRVMSFHTLVTLGGIPISYTLTGLLVGLSSATTPFVIGGALSAAAGIVALQIRSISAAELPTANTPAGEDG